MDKSYLEIVAHYESCLEEHGDTHRGVDWPNPEDAETRYRVMLEMITPARRRGRVRLLDFGCGASHLYQHILSHGLDGVEYAGLDLSSRFVDLSRSKFPANTYYCLDILEDGASVPSFDFIIANGVFTEKRGLTHDAMVNYWQRLIATLFAHVEVGLAFNVMSTHVDWEREDLFHVPLDELAAYLTEHVSRSFTIRNDYGLYEYTTYVYR